MEPFINKLRRDYPGFTFVAGPQASWSSNRQQITYPLDSIETSVWTILHELGHGLLGHTSYRSDLHLLQMEASAWEKAQELAAMYGLTIERDHVQDCLDTYRDWLHKRSTCPSCGNHGLQPTQKLYRCLNCRNTWSVSSARFCRPYRLKSTPRT